MRAPFLSFLLDLTITCFRSPSRPLLLRQIPRSRCQKIRPAHNPTRSPPTRALSGRRWMSSFRSKSLLPLRLRRTQRHPDSHCHLTPSWSLSRLPICLMHRPHSVTAQPPSSPLSTGLPYNETFVFVIKASFRTHPKGEHARGYHTPARVVSACPAAQGPLRSGERVL